MPISDNKYEKDRGGFLWKIAYLIQSPRHLTDPICLFFCINTRPFFKLAPPESASKRLINVDLYSKQSENKLSEKKLECIVYFAVHDTWILPIDGPERGLRNGFVPIQEIHQIRAFVACTDFPWKRTSETAVVVNIEHFRNECH